MPDNEDRIFLGHTSAFPVATITRPADTAAYAAGDVLGTEMTFDGCARSAGGKGMIASAMVVDSANQATPPDLELWLFSSPISDASDNAPFVPTDVELASLVGIIPFPNIYIGNATSGAGGNLAAKSDVEMLGFACAAASDDLSGVLVVRNAYTPVSAEVITVRLAVLQDY